MSKFESWYVFLPSLILFFAFNFSASAQENTVSPTILEKTAINETEPRQTEETSYQLRRGAREFNFEAGYSPFEPTHFAGPKEYNTVGRKLGAVNFRLGRVIGTKKAITYSYLFGFTPFVISLKNEVLNSDYVSAEATPNVPRTKRETSYGFGVAPVNFRFTFFSKRRIKPYAQVGAGILLFNKSMPLPESRKLQFTGDFGGGLQIHQSPNKAWFFGYKYFHISNGNFTEKKYNVGYNANVFYIGYSFFK